MFSRANWSDISDELSQFSKDYFDNLVNSDIDTKWQHIKETLTSTIDKHVPSKMSSKRYHVPWITKSLKRLSRKKQRLYNQAKKTSQKS